MKIGNGQRKGKSAMTVVRAMEIAAWRQADPATRGPHPVSPPSEQNSARSPWRGSRAGMLSKAASAHKLESDAKLRQIYRDGAPKKARTVANEHVPSRRKEPGP